jgi:propanediol dehydratase small subunit
MTRLKIEDYPLAETRPGDVRGRRGLSLDDITLDAVLAGDVTMEDLRITPGALRDQAEIARAAGRSTLARNFERAAELVEVPQDLVMETYELLRPGRAKSKQEILDRAELFRSEYSAPGIASFLEEAAEAYDRRGLFTFRF